MRQERKKPQFDCYFKAIAYRVGQIDTLAHEYLNTFEFFPNDAICERIWNAALSKFEGSTKKWDDETLPEWVLLTMDGRMPYACESRNGSLFYSLAFSPASRDAHLRNLLEIAEGRTAKELEFPVMAEKEVCAALCGML